MGGVTSPFPSGVPFTGGEITGDLKVDGNLTGSAPLLLSAFTPVVPMADVAVGGTNANTVLFTGLSVTAGGFAAGQVYRMTAWGTCHTIPPGTDTFTLSVNIGSSQIVSVPPQITGSATSATVPWYFNFECVLRTNTQLVATAWVAFNSLFSSFSNSSPIALTNTSVQQLAVYTQCGQITSAITCQGASCIRLL